MSANPHTTVSAEGYRRGARLGVACGFGRASAGQALVGVGSLLWLLSLLIPAGCSTRTTSLVIVDYRDTDQPRRYGETFDQAYFDLDDQGNVDIVLRRSNPATDDPHRNVTQTVHIRGVWRSIPGQTIAQRTQINGTVRYGIVSDGVAGSFAGAGALFFKHHRRRDVLTGTLEAASLKPMRSLGGGGVFLGPARLSGRFRAERNPGRVVSLVNDMNRLLRRQRAQAAVSSAVQPIRSNAGPIGVPEP